VAGCRLRHRVLEDYKFVSDCYVCFFMFDTM